MPNADPLQVHRLKPDSMPRRPAESAKIPWEAEVLRLTCFQAPSAILQHSTWWSDVTGDSPENRVQQPKKGIYQDNGPFANGNLSLRIEPTRIDWIFNKPPNDDASRFSFEEARRFNEGMLRWLMWCPPLLRLAFGAVLTIPVESREEGYNRITHYLPHVKLDPESSDFMYQINRPRRVELGGTVLAINRLSKWAISMVESRQITPFAEHIVVTRLFACRLELDISTPPDFKGELPHDKLGTIFEVLVDYGREIATEGDKS
jgi:hypothetical protein